MLGLLHPHCPRTAEVTCSLETNFAPRELASQDESVAMSPQIHSRPSRALAASLALTQPASVRRTEHGAADVINHPTNASVGLACATYLVRGASQCPPKSSTLAVTRLA